MTIQQDLFLAIACNSAEQLTNFSQTLLTSIPSSITATNPKAQHFLWQCAAGFFLDIFSGASMPPKQSGIFLVIVWSPSISWAGLASWAGHDNQTHLDLLCVILASLGHE